MKNGGEEFIILHIESQGSGGGSLPERMNHYRCLIYSHYRREPVALAIITDGHKHEERLYSHSLFGTKCLYEYNNLVLADLDDDELLSSDNPVDFTLYAGKCASRSKKEIQNFNYLRTLTKLLTERGWSRDEKRDLMLFIARILYLRDEELRTQHREYYKQLTREGKNMPRSFLVEMEEEEVEQRGIEKGKEEMAREMARNLLADGVSPDIVAKSASMSVEQIRALAN
ncbi:MAG: hypothetical protein LBT31_02085 [Synergistaceae bacterium]|nr:hypothetical protein [Synergistaceae bacterium]